MAMEQFCAAQSVGGRLIPVPRELSAGCGLAWRMLPEEFPALDRFWADETRRQLSVGDFRIDIEEIAVLSL
jgi:hypothetical protein